MDSTGSAVWPDYRLSKASLQGAVPVVVVTDRSARCARVLRLPSSHRQRRCSSTRFGRAGAIVAGAAALDAARIEAGYPVFGVDMTSDTIPLEAGIEDRAISFSKGCYVGQEVIIRVLHRGHGRVAKKLVGLRIDGPTISARREGVWRGIAKSVRSRAWLSLRSSARLRSHTCTETSSSRAPRFRCNLARTRTRRPATRVGLPTVRVQRPGLHLRTSRLAGPPASESTRGPPAETRASPARRARPIASAAPEERRGRPISVHR